MSKIKKILIASLIVSLFPVCSGAAGTMIADVSLKPAGDFKAKSQDVTGFAVQKGDSIFAENIIVNLKKLTTGISLRDKHAREKYLEVEKYPTVVLIKAEGKNGKGKGRIKWRDRENDIEGTYTIAGGEVLAKFPIKLSEFGVTGIKYMGIGVDDTVSVAVRVPIKK